MNNSRTAVRSLPFPPLLSLAQVSFAQVKQHRFQTSLFSISLNLLALPVHSLPPAEPIANTNPLQSQTTVIVPTDPLSEPPTSNSQPLRSDVADPPKLPSPSAFSSSLAPSLPLSSAPPPSPSPPPPSPYPLNLDPKLIKQSPVLQRWLRQVPDVLSDIQHDPSFRTHLRLGYAQFPSTNQAGGWIVGIEDVFWGRTGVTFSADYQAAFNRKRAAWGTDLRYYLLPLGNRINFAPVVGYRHLETPRYTTDGFNVGARLLLVPSRTGAATLSLTQSWVAPGSDRPVSLTTLSFGYALTHHVRLSTDVQWQSDRQHRDNRLGIALEWMF